MLKIRIAGTEAELRQISHKTGNTQILRFKRDNGKTTFAIDVQISVNDFLENLDLSNYSATESATENSSADKKANCNAQEIQAELEDILKEISDK